MQIETENIYKDQAEKPNIFDFNYLGNLFLMKDKTKGSPIGKLVCLNFKAENVFSSFSRS